jgi:uncharacterized membrane protein YeaQ/YmgE (transglycosylase-associated protein family)
VDAQELNGSETVYAVAMGVVFFILLAIVVFAIVGGAIMGILLHLIWWAIVGLVIGLVARMLVTDDRGPGIVETILFGIGGALLGGVLAGLFDVGWFIELLLAIIVAALLIYVFGNTKRRSGSGVTRTR